jgi:hypothetical protein
MRSKRILYADCFDHGMRCNYTGVVRRRDDSKVLIICTKLRLLSRLSFPTQILWIQVFLLVTVWIAFAFVVVLRERDQMRESVEQQVEKRTHELYEACRKLDLAKAKVIAVYTLCFRLLTTL